LILIGGHEDRTGDRLILREVVRHACEGKSRLIVVPTASDVPAEYTSEYVPLFHELGVKHVEVVDARNREEAHDPGRIAVIEEADVVFFTGGNQLRLTSQIGGTPLCECLRAIHDRGATLAGTSAGAAAMSQTMLVSGPSDQSSTSDTLDMAPGLGFVDRVVVDTHFAERGRIGRLVGAVARNPRNLGLGLDEDTAVVVTPEGRVRVIGSGVAYIVDGGHIAYSSLAERRAAGVVSVHDLRLHVLGMGNQYDLNDDRPHPPADRPQAEESERSSESP
jgi:cyanophycinase